MVYMVTVKTHGMRAERRFSTAQKAFETIGNMVDDKYSVDGVTVHALNDNDNVLRKWTINKNQ